MGRVFDNLHVGNGVVTTTNSFILIEVKTKEEDLVNRLVHKRHFIKNNVQRVDAGENNTAILFEKKGDAVQVECANNEDYPKYEILFEEEETFIQPIAVNKKELKKLLNAFPEEIVLLLIPKDNQKAIQIKSETARGLIMPINKI